MPTSHTSYRHGQFLMQSYMGSIKSFVNFGAGAGGVGNGDWALGKMQDGFFIPAINKNYLSTYTLKYIHIHVQGSFSSLATGPQNPAYPRLRDNAY